LGLQVANLGAKAQVTTLRILVS